jgi:hypothetical protein
MNNQQASSTSSVSQTRVPAPKNPEAFQALLEVEEEERTAKKREGYLKAYLWSIFLPPLGIYYFIKYMFFVGESDQDKKTGIYCLILTIVSFLVSWWILEVFFGQLTSSFNSQSGQIFQELITPGNQKSLQQLYK